MIEARNSSTPKRWSWYTWPLPVQNSQFFCCLKNCIISCGLMLLTPRCWDVLGFGRLSFPSDPALPAAMFCRSCSATLNCTTGSDAEIDACRKAVQVGILYSARVWIILRSIQKANWNTLSLSLRREEMSLGFKSLFNAVLTMLDKYNQAWIDQGSSN